MFCAVFSAVLLTMGCLFCYTKLVFYCSSSFACVHAFAHLSETLTHKTKEATRLTKSLQCSRQGIYRGWNGLALRWLDIFQCCQEGSEKNCAKKEPSFNLFGAACRKKVDLKPGELVVLLLIGFGFAVFLGVVYVYILI